MDADQYDKMAAVEDVMWWYRGLRAHLLRETRVALKAGGRLLDAGCGTGGLLRLLAAEPGTRDASLGLEYDGRAAELAARRSGLAVVRGSIDQLPFADGSLDVVVSADVLCHAGVAETRALDEIARCLKPGGSVVLSLPAYGWMASAHDRRVHNARRYSRGQLVRLVAAHGFTPVKASYWNTLLFPLMVLQRKVLSAGEASGSDVHLYPPVVEGLFGRLLAIEAWAMRLGLSLPFGGSILIRAVKHG